jgi:hypothetical protein
VGDAAAEVPPQDSLKPLLGEGVTSRDEQRNSFACSVTFQLATVEALHANATLDLAEFEALAAHYRSDQILEIMMLCGFYRMVAYVSNGLDLPLEPGAARFPPAPVAAA